MHSVCPAPAAPIAATSTPCASPPAAARDFPTRAGPPSAPLRLPARFPRVRRLLLPGGSAAPLRDRHPCGAVASTSRVYEGMNSSRLPFRGIEDQSHGPRERLPLGLLRRQLLPPG